MVEQWDAVVAKVGGKVFALRSNSGGVVFKVGEIAFAGLTSIPGIEQAPYFAKGGWVHVGPEAEFPDDDLAGYIRESHRMVAAKLTRKMQAELGLAG